MKISKIIALLVTVTFIFSLVSCDQLHFHNGGSNNPHDNTNNPNQNQNQEPNQDENGDEGGEGTITYIYSVLSKTMHLPDCYHTGNIKEDYKFEYTGDINLMLGKGYTICKDCLVPEDEKEDEEKEDEEDENLIAKEDATYATHKVKLVIHLLDCYTLESMSEENLRYTDLSYEELLDLEYRPCGTCMPDEYKQYKEEHPEEFE